MAVSKESIIVDSATGFKPGATVELWAVDANGDPTTLKATTANGTITDNGDGSYTVDMEAVDLDPGAYSFRVNNVYQDEQKARYIPTIRNLHRNQLDNITLEWDGEQVRIKADGVQASHLNSDVVGNGLQQNSDGSLSPAVDGATITINAQGELEASTGGSFSGNATDVSVADAESKFAGSDVEAVLTELGTKLGLDNGILDFSTTEYLGSVSTALAALIKLDRVLSTLDLSDSGFNEHWQLYYDRITDTTPSGALSMPVYVCSLNADEDAIKFPFLKVGILNYLLFACKLTHATANSTESSYVKISVTDGTDTVSTTVTVGSNTNGNYGNKTTYLGIDDLKDGICEVTIQMNNMNTGDGDFSMKNVTVQATAF